MSYAMKMKLGLDPESYQTPEKLLKIVNKINAVQVKRAVVNDSTYCQLHFDEENRPSVEFAAFCYGKIKAIKIYDFHPDKDAAALTDLLIGYLKGKNAFEDLIQNQS